jgi:spermidine synthase
VAHGFVLAKGPESRLVDEEASLFGPVRVSDRVWGRSRRIERTLSLGGRILGGTHDGRALRVWERAATTWVLAAAEATSGESRSVLLLGASAVSFHEGLRRAGVGLTIVERNPVVWRMAVRHFGVPRTADDVRVETGDVIDRVLDAGRFGFVVVDGGGWDGGAPLPSVTLLSRFRRALSPAGVLLLGADDPDLLTRAEAACEVRGLLARSGFSQARAFAGLDREGPGRLLLVAGSAEAALPIDLPEMRSISLEGDAV